MLRLGLGKLPPAENGHSLAHGVMLAKFCQLLADDISENTNGLRRAQTGKLLNTIIAQALTQEKTIRVGCMAAGTAKIYDKARDYLAVSIAPPVAATAFRSEAGNRAADALASAFGQRFDTLLISACLTQAQASAARLALQADGLTGAKLQEKTVVGNKDVHRILPEIQMATAYDSLRRLDLSGLSPKGLDRVVETLDRADRSFASAPAMKLEAIAVGISRVFKTEPTAANPIALGILKDIVAIAKEAAVARAEREDDALAAKSARPPAALLKALADPSLAASAVRPSARVLAKQPPASLLQALASPEVAAPAAQAPALEKKPAKPTAKDMLAFQAGLFSKRPILVRPGH